MRAYTELASWWPLFSPPSHYVEEAQDLLPVLLHAPDVRPTTLLELGAGGGGIVVVPDHVRETFEPDTDHGGEDGPDGRGLRYLEWRWDPDATDTTFEVAYAFVLRDVDGSVRVEGDRHVEGLFPRESWLIWLRDAGFDAQSRLDPWRRDVFAGRKVR